MSIGIPTHDEVVPFTAGDGVELNLVHVRGDRAPTRGPVLLVHGAGVRGNIFRAPVETTIVDALLEAGWDVWLENWRASIDLPLRDWTLDHAARFDHPAAVDKVLAETGADTLKALVHCQGSTSFTMSAVAGLLPRVDTIVSNAVSLHPVVAPWSVLKLKAGIPVFARLMRSMNPGWGDHPDTAMGRLLLRMVRLSHHECDNSACRLVSFTYGAGQPALWRHENLNRQTHEHFIEAEFGHVPMTFFLQMRRCVQAGHMVVADPTPGLPDDFSGPPQTDARFVFLAGQQNLCFLAESQRRSYDFFDGHRRRYHGLHIFPTYSHLDIFLGQRAAGDVFPVILEELAA